MKACERPVGTTRTSKCVRKRMKEPADEHFDDMSAGDIVRQLADRNGYDAKVSESFDQLVIPYIARTNQSTADFLSRLAKRTGAQFSIKDGKFLFLEPGILAPVTIHKAECKDWLFSIEPRPTYSRAKAGWYNRDTGTVETTTAQTGLEGPSNHLCQPGRSRSRRPLGSRQAGRKDRLRVNQHGRSHRYSGRHHDQRRRLPPGSSGPLVRQIGASPVFQRLHHPDQPGSNEGGQKGMK